MDHKIDAGPNDVLLRLEKLERENRRFKSIAILSVSALASLALMAPTTVRQAATNTGSTAPDEIRAKRFVVVDDTGKVRATLETQNMGWPHLSRAGLTVYSADNQRKASISSDNLMDQVSVENNEVGSGSRYARMQVGTEGVGLELSEFFLTTSNHNLFGVHWSSARQDTPTLEISKSKPNASVRVTPGGNPVMARKP